jgi:hypothetical protein
VYTAPCPVRSSVRKGAERFAERTHFLKAEMGFFLPKSTPWGKSSKRILIISYYKILCAITNNEL